MDYAFFKNQFLSICFPDIFFVFFDFERPALLFFTEYAAIMGLFVFHGLRCNEGDAKTEWKEKGG